MLVENIYLSRKPLRWVGWSVELDIPWVGMRRSTERAKTMGDTGRLSFDRRQKEEVLVLELAGSLVAGPESQLIRREVEGLLEAGSSKILLNLAQVRQLDSTGIGMLVAVKTSAARRNAQVKLCCAPRLIARLLEQLHLTKLLEAFEQEGPALESFR